MLCRDIQCDLGQKQVGADPGGRRDVRLFKDRVHDPLCQLSRPQVIELLIGRDVEEGFVDGVDMDVLGSDKLQQDAIDADRVIHVQLHAGRCRDIFDAFGDLKDAPRLFTPWRLMAGVAASVMAPLPRSGSATTRLTAKGSRPRSTHSTEAKNDLRSMHR